MPKINPFFPSQPVNPDMFVGRVDEIKRIEKALRHTQSGRPSNSLIIGERGIGKTSLLLYARAVADGTIPPLDGEPMEFVVLDLDVDDKTSPTGLLRKIELSLRQELGKWEDPKSLFEELWSIAKRIESIGPVSLTGQSEQIPADETLLDEFAYSLAATVNKLTTGEGSVMGPRDGLVIFVDEADNASPDLGLGAFLKLLSERLQRRQCNRVSFVLAGLPNLPDLLFESHPSALRLFERLDLARLSNATTSEVINAALARAGRDNGRVFNIDATGRSLLIQLSEGYPHFIQQFGHSAFDADTDDVIDEDDVMDSAFGMGGALDLIGDRYYRSDFYQRIQKDSYRQVLRIMARLSLDGFVSKQQVREKFRGSEAVLSNAIKALRDRGMIVSKEGVRGVYRLRHQAFALWIRLIDGKRSETLDLNESE